MQLFQNDITDKVWSNIFGAFWNRYRYMALIER